MTANQNTHNIGNGYQPAKLVQINQRRKPRNLKVTIPSSVQPTVFAPKPAPAYAPVCQPTTESAKVDDFNFNDFMKIDTPTAKHVEKMALTGQESLFTLFDL